MNLPIDEILPDIVAQLASAVSALPAKNAAHTAPRNLVLEAPPGAGKTTRVPAALLAAPFLCEREIWVLEPRRLAARMAARRVAEECGERLGERVGYQVRFEEVASAQTRLRFLTEGVLTRRLLADPQLPRVGAVILDEFHERHLQTDLALALLRHLQRTTRPDLRLIVMSATLDAAPVATYLDAPRLRAEGRRFDIAIEFAARETQAPLAEQVAHALRRICLESKADKGANAATHAEVNAGDVLVFLPGAAEIRAAQAACAELAQQFALELLPLHGELPTGEQDRAVRPRAAGAPRRVILATNVAESSLTIEGVTVVVDAGLARVATHSPWSGLPALTVQRISQAAATQRAGRAGRTQPGRCVRLYTQADFNARPAFETPEIQRLDLTETALALHAVGVRDLSAFDWFEAPHAAALAQADTLLQRLGALTAQGELTELGRTMLRYPTHPRLARLLIEAQRRGAGRAACTIAALIGERDILARDLFATNTTRPSAPRGSHAAQHNTHGPSDLLERADRFAEAERANFAPERLRALGLDVGATLAVERARQQLLNVQKRVSGNAASLASASPSQAHELDEALQLALLAAYPDRVARRRSLKITAENSGELLLSSGGTALLSPSSVVQQAEFLVAISAETPAQRGNNRGANPLAGRAGLVRWASAIEPDWLIELGADALRETVEARWHATHERVEVVEQMFYDQLVISETRVTQLHRESIRQEVARVLAEAALAAGWQRFAESEAVENFLQRVAFAARAFPAADFPALRDEDVRTALAALCAGLRSFADLRAATGNHGNGLLDGLRARLDGAQQRLLAQHVPATISLPKRHNVRVHYTADQPPWIASRLQDFFGLRETPRIAQGRVALVVQLLAPNQRPVQITSDLAGFWTRHYPAIRRELSRRYPRHAWPEDPLQPSA